MILSTAPYRNNETSLENVKLNVEYYGYHLTAKNFLSVFGTLNQVKTILEQETRSWMFKPGALDIFFSSKRMSVTFKATVLMK